MKCANFFFSFFPLLSVEWSDLHRVHFFFEKELKVSTLNKQCVSEGSLGMCIKRLLNSFCANLQKNFPVDSSTLERASPQPRGLGLCSGLGSTVCRQESLLSLAKGGCRPRGPVGFFSA